MRTEELYPVPDHYRPESVEKVWRVPYQERAQQAQLYAKKHNIPPAADDDHRTELVLIDVQNTFCLPEFELFVGGRSGVGAVEDNRRLVVWLYQHLGEITGITATMDTHHPLQIFHPMFLVDQEGNFPEPNTQITLADVQQGIWQVNPNASRVLGYDPETLNEYLVQYAQELAEMEKYQLLIWPYHALLGGIGHALVSAVEEAVFFHSVARETRVEIRTKGDHPLTEAYSAIGPEVVEGPGGAEIAEKSDFLIEKLKNAERMIIAGQAKSHCVAWTVSDLLTQIQAEDPALAERVYLLEDCTSPVVIPGVIDFTDRADQSYQQFQEAGMHLVTTEAFPA